MAQLPPDWNERAVQTHQCWPVGEYEAAGIRWSSKVTVYSGGPGLMNPVFTQRNLDVSKHLMMRASAAKKQPYTTRQAHGNHKAGETVTSWAEGSKLYLEYPDGDVVELPLSQYGRPGIDPPYFLPPRVGLVDV